MFADAKTVHATGALMMTMSTIEGYVDRKRAEVKDKTDSRQDGGVHAVVMALERAAAERESRASASWTCLEKVESFF